MALVIELVGVGFELRKRLCKSGWVPGWGGPNLAEASQPIPLRANCENPKVWAYTNFRLTVEFGCSHIEPELREFVEGD